jgi:hypothetical protein
VESGFVERFLDVCGVPAADLPAAVARSRELVSSAGLGLLEVTMSGGAGQVRMLAAVEPATPSAAV